jgi:hypothetical protein
MDARCINTRAAQRIKVTNMPVLYVFYSGYKNKICAVVKIRILLLMIYSANEGKENKKYNEFLSKLYLSTSL